MNEWNRAEGGEAEMRLVGEGAVANQAGVWVGAVEDNKADFAIGTCLHGQAHRG